MGDEFIVRVHSDTIKDGRTHVYVPNVVEECQTWTCRISPSDHELKVQLGAESLGANGRSGAAYIYEEVDAE